MKPNTYFLSIVVSLCCCAFAAPSVAKPFRPSVAVKGKRFVEQLSWGKFDAARRSFDATMSRVVSTPKLATLWRSLEAQKGSFQRIANLRAEPVGSKHWAAFVSCQFKKELVDLKVVFDKKGRIAGLFVVPPRSAVKWSAPSYAKRGSFREQQVTVGRGQWKLPGTLTLPAGKRRVAAVVLVHGSGPNNRDEAVGGIRVFKDIAWGLASKGIAVLRYDKRTLIHGKKIVSQKLQLTFNEEVVDDAVAAVALLRKHRRIDPKRVFIIGHSLGGMVAPKIGQRNPSLAGIVILAGNSRPLPELVVEQVKYLAGLDGKIDPAERKEIAAAKAFHKKALSKHLKPTAKVKMLGTTTPGRYWIAFRDYDQKKTASRLKMPIFIVQGKRDYQVTTKDFAGWKRALSGHKNVSFKLYTSCNHLFVSGKGRSVPDEYFKSGNVHAPLIADLAQWITRQR